MAPVDAGVLLDLVATGALVVAGGVVYHGHIQTGVAGRMVLVDLKGANSCVAPQAASR